MQGSHAGLHKRRLQDVVNPDMVPAWLDLIGITPTSKAPSGDELPLLLPRSAGDETVLITLAAIAARGGRSQEEVTHAGAL